MIQCTADEQLIDAVAKQLESVQEDLNEFQTESCGKCAKCFLNNDNCDDCTVGTAGCPIESYNKMTTLLSLLKVE